MSTITVIYYQKSLHDEWASNTYHLRETGIHVTSANRNSDYVAEIGR